LKILYRASGHLTHGTCRLFSSIQCPLGHNSLDAPDLCTFDVRSEWYHLVRQPENRTTPIAKSGLSEFDRRHFVARQDVTSIRYIYVPSDHPAKYSSCSGVRRSILIPMDSSFSFATRLSSSSGTLYTFFSRVL